jgi:hypothetical protein
MLSVAATAYATATGDGQQVYWDAVHRAAGSWPDDPVGQQFDFEDGQQTRSHYPRLTAHFHGSATPTV